MNLYWVHFQGEEWGSFVIAGSRGRAKSLFFDFWTNEGWYIDVRCWKIKSVDQQTEAVYDQDCPELEAMGVSFAPFEEEDDDGTA